MTDYHQNHIELDAFDREYTIEELLPRDMLRNFSAGAAALLPTQWAILTEKGSVHYQCGPWNELPPDQLIEDVMAHTPEIETIVKAESSGSVIYFPIDYEMELKGYMAVWASEEHRQDLMAVCRAGVHMFKQLIQLKHQTMMTSGLHGLVVEESYAELKNKAEELARSEEKYRKLSVNLEIEVQKKTEEIRTAHAHLMQHEKMAAIGQLSAGMAHEINNPLGFILSNLTTLKSYGDDLSALIEHYRSLVKLCNEDVTSVISPTLYAQCKIVQEMEHNLDGDFLLSDIPVLVEESATGASRIKKIVKDLKAVARPGESNKEQINVHESIDAVLTIVQNRIGPKLEVRREFGPVPLFYGYPQEVSQVWLNLILNAIDALENQGVLKIATQADRDHIIVSVTDTGIGIPQEILSKIFDPFFTTKDVGKGTGLGLHLAYHLIAKHDGRIEVQSQAGLGTTLTVYLPADKG